MGEGLRGDFRVNEIQKGRRREVFLHLNHTQAVACLQNALYK